MRAIRNDSRVTLLTRANSDRPRGIEYSIIDFASSAGDPRDIARSTSSWLNSAEMAALLARFNQMLTATGLRSRLAEAEQISREIFDFRQGGERWEAEKIEFSPCTAEAVDALIGRIYRDPYDDPAAEFGVPTHGLVLGGASTAACCAPSCSPAFSIRACTSNASGALAAGGMRATWNAR
jgi:hypothetical protein